MGFGKQAASDEEQSEFNASIATLRRIDEIKKQLIIATATEDYDFKWRMLKAFFLELVSVMDESDDKEQREKFFEVRKNYNMYSTAKAQGAESVPAKLVDSIDDWEIELKNVEQKYGLNMLKKADPRYALASR